MFKVDTVDVIFALIALVIIILVSLLIWFPPLIISDTDATQSFMKEAGTTQVLLDHKELGFDLIVYQLHVDGKPAQGLCVKANEVVNCKIFTPWPTATPQPQ